jgi:hypothetical protein
MKKEKKKEEKRSALVRNFDAIQSQLLSASLVIDRKKIRMR